MHAGIILLQTKSLISGNHSTTVIIGDRHNNSSFVALYGQKGTGLQPEDPLQARMRKTCLQFGTSYFRDTMRVGRNQDLKGLKDSQLPKRKATEN